MKLIYVFLLSCASVLITLEVKAQKQKVVYKYKKYQKFNFEDLSIGGEAGGPGDLSVDRRFQYRFKNRLPYRRTFTPEIRKSVERIR